MVTTSPRRRMSLALGLLATLVLLMTTAAKPAAAAPGDPGNEGSTPTLAEVLENANRDYLDAQTVLEQSKQRQATLNNELAEIERELAPVLAEVNTIASAAYRTGGLGPAAALLSSGSSNDFMERAVMVNTIAVYNDRMLKRLIALRDRVASTKKSIDTEVATQQSQVDIMGKKKNDAEKALAAAGGRANGFVSASSPLANPAPRGANGAWPKESCIVDDPTTGGCITARTLHALKEAKRAGFTRFVSCYRPGGPYEHPKGRACDFAAQPNNFGGDATGGDKVYGANLAVFFVRNASALGVLYVIWYRQIWSPATGWRHYSGSGGDPSSDHTNHVHLSMY